MKQSIIFLVRFYRNYVRWIFPGSCRFHPSCSQYYVEAIQRFGIISGSWKGLKRILRCNPLFLGGHDPLEPRKAK